MAESVIPNNDTQGLAPYWIPVGSIAVGDRTPNYYPAGWYNSNPDFDQFFATTNHKTYNLRWAYQYAVNLDDPPGYLWPTYSGDNAFAQLIAGAGRYWSVVDVFQSSAPSVSKTRTVTVAVSDTTTELASLTLGGGKAVPGNIMLQYQVENSVTDTTETSVELDFTNKSGSAYFYVTWVQYVALGLCYSQGPEDHGGLLSFEGKVKENAPDFENRYGNRQINFNPAQEWLNFPTTLISTIAYDQKGNGPRK